MDILCIAHGSTQNLIISKEPHIAKVSKKDRYMSWQCLGHCEKCTWLYLQWAKLSKFCWPWGHRFETGNMQLIFMLQLSLKFKYKSI